MLTIKSFLSRYIINTQSENLSISEKKTCLAVSIVLGILSFGIPHLASLFYQKVIAKPLKKNDSTSTQNTDTTFKNIMDPQEILKRIIVDGVKLPLDKNTINLINKKKLEKESDDYFPEFFSEKELELFSSPWDYDYSDDYEEYVFDDSEENIILQKTVEVDNKKIFTKRERESFYGTDTELFEDELIQEPIEEEIQTPPLSKVMSLNAEKLSDYSSLQLLTLYKTALNKVTKLNENNTTKSSLKAKKLRCTLFEIKEAILRQTEYLNFIPGFMDKIGLDDPKLRSAVETLTSFDRSTQAFTTLAELTEAATQGKFSDINPKPLEEQVRALHVTMEYEKAMAGGVGSVAQSLLYKMNEAKLDARVITPFYDVYRGDDSFRDAKFMGFITHEVDGVEFKSSIYKVWGQGGKVPHYLVKPDPTKSELFDIKEPNNIYATIPGGSGMCERSIYFGTVVAALGGTYKGKKHHKQFDVLHFHTFTATFAAHLLKSKYTPLRKKANLAKVHTVQHFHHGSLDYQEPRHNEVYKKFGIDDLPKKIATVINPLQDFWLHSDGLLFVSPVNASNSITSKHGEGLHKEAQHLHKNGRLTSVMNGITWSDHSLISGKAHGQYSINQVIGDDGITDETDYVAEKQKIKQALFEAGIVPHKDKPLYLFVGRYSPEKGIDKLQGIAEEIIKLGGQCVVMGWGEHATVPKDIQKLKKFAAKHPDSLRVYTERKDQLDTFETSMASKGNLIRGASDFLLMPSEFEGNSMTVWEGLARGNIIISSMGGGLKAQCFDLNDVGEAKFNSFGYKNSGRVKKHIAEAIKRSMDFYREKNSVPGEWNKVVGRIFRESEKNDWLVKDGPVEQIQTFYKNVMKDYTDEEIRERQHLLDQYYKKPNIPKKKG